MTNAIAEMSTIAALLAADGIAGCLPGKCGVGVVACDLSPKAAFLRPARFSSPVRRSGPMPGPRGASFEIDDD